MVFTHYAMRDYHNKGLLDKTLLILHILDHISGAGMKGLFALLCLKSPVLFHHPGGFNMEIRAKSTAAHAMITRLVIFFFPPWPCVEPELTHLTGLEHLFMGHL